MKKLIPFWKIKNDGNYEINTNHDWYYQIQGQLHITNKKMYIGSVDRKKQTKNVSNRKKITTFGTKNEK
jgi:hypothetical protein